MGKEQASVSSPETRDGILVDKTSLHEVAEMTEAMTGGDFHRKLNVTLTGEFARIAKHIDQTRKELAKVTPEIMDEVRDYIPNACEELSRVTTDTEKATHEILEKTETIMDAVVQTREQYGLLKELFIKHADSAGEEGVRHLEQLEEERQKQELILTEILTTLSFQDLAGQKIKKIISMIETVESKILDLLNIFGITKEKIEVMEHSPNRERTLNSFSQQPLKQDLVDDLLKELDL